MKQCGAKHTHSASSRYIYDSNIALVNISYEDNSFQQGDWCTQIKCYNIAHIEQPRG